MTCTAFMCNSDPNCKDVHCPGRSSAIQINGGCTVERGVAVAWTEDPAYVADEPAFAPEEMEDWTFTLLLAVVAAFAIVAILMPFIFRD